MQDLMVLHDDNGSFIDHSKSAKDFLRDDFTIDYTPVEDFIYVGLYKPFNAFYCEFSTAAAIQGNLSFTTNNNSLSVDDDTQSFTRNGFIQFEKPENWTKQIINGVEAYWLRISSDTAIAPIFRGLNLVFSDDNDLRQEVRRIDDLMEKDDTSFIAYHVASRNEIIQTLRNGGNTKKVDDIVRNITKWDMLDIGEIRQASKYLTLAKIYFDNSVNSGDQYDEKHGKYMGMFGGAFQLWISSIDKNDDGKYEQDKDLVLNNIEVKLV